MALALAEGSSGGGGYRGEGRGGGAYRGGGGGRGGYFEGRGGGGGRQRHNSGGGAIVKARGLPYSTTEWELANFFEEYDVRAQFVDQHFIVCLDINIACMYIATKMYILCGYIYMYIYNINMYTQLIMYMHVHVYTCMISCVYMSILSFVYQIYEIKFRSVYFQHAH